jgi:hypothetical protein
LSYLKDDDPLQNVSVGSISNYVAVFTMPHNSQIKYLTLII